MQFMVDVIVESQLSKPRLMERSINEKFDYWNINCLMERSIIRTGCLRCKQERYVFMFNACMYVVFSFRLCFLFLSNHYSLYVGMYDVFGLLLAFID